MTWTAEKIEEEKAKTERILSAYFDLEVALRRVLDSPEYEELGNDGKAEVLMKLENLGEYDPDGF